MSDTEEPLDSALGWVADHTRRYVESDGEDGHEWMGVPTFIPRAGGARAVSVAMR